MFETTTKTHMDVSKNRGNPQKGWFIMENRIGNGWFGGKNPLFLETLIFSMVDYPRISRVLYIQGGCLGFQPSTVPLIFSMWSLDFPSHHLQLQPVRVTLWPSPPKAPGFLPRFFKVICWRKNKNHAATKLLGIIFFQVLWGKSNKFFETKKSCPTTPTGKGGILHINLQFAGICHP